MPEAMTIAQERVNDLSAKFAKNAWLKDIRLAAWEAYLQQPAASVRDDAWRKTIIETLDLSSLMTLDIGPIEQISSSLPQCFQSAMKHFENNAGAIYQGTKEAGYCKLTSEMAEKGVILCDLATALERHEALIKPYLTKGTNAQVDGKFGLMTKALFNCGVFLYVPKGVQIAQPIVSGLGLGQAADSQIGGAIFPWVIVVAEQGSKVDFVNYLGSTAQSQNVGDRPNALAAGLVDIYVGQDADVSYLELQQFADNVFSISRVANEVNGNGRLNALTVALGGKQVKSDIATYLKAPGASSEVLGLVLGSKGENFTFNTIEEHNAPDTTSDINFRVALKDNASSVYQGIIRVDKVAQRINALQSNKNLLLGSEAKADSIPKLEILADDVKCAHGATVGPVDAEQVFYLMSRGLTRAQAEELIVNGFFRQIIEQFAFHGAEEWVAEAVSQKIFAK